MSENFHSLVQKLKILKNEYCMTGLKLELETEIISTAEIDLAHQLASAADIALTVKTGGCSAVSDIFIAKALDIKNLLTPMIESSYALDKFYENVKHIYNEIDLKLMFNLETKFALYNIDDILQSKNLKHFDTLVFGRNDFCCSLGYGHDAAESEEIFEAVLKVLEKIKNTHLNFTVGGNISSKSEPFLKRIKSSKFTNFETRKIIFDKEILHGDFEEALRLALEFELLWLESKSFKNLLDEERKSVLKSRI